MKISNGFRSGCVTATLLCFVLTSNAAVAERKKTSGKLPLPFFEPFGEVVNKKKFGKITALALDTKTDAITVTVTVGTLNPVLLSSESQPAQKSGTPSSDILSLSDETISFALHDDIKILNGFYMASPREVRSRRVQGESQPNAARDFIHSQMSRFYDEQEAQAAALKIGEIVQLFYDDDESAVKAIRVFSSLGKKLVSMGRAEDNQTE